MTGEQLALRPWTEDARPEWIDYNGHLSEATGRPVGGERTSSG